MGSTVAVQPCERLWSQYFIDIESWQAVLVLVACFILPCSKTAVLPSPFAEFVCMAEENCRGEGGGVREHAGCQSRGKS